MTSDSLLRHDADKLTASLLMKADFPISLSEQRVVSTASDEVACVPTSPALSDEYRAGRYQLAAVRLDAKTLRIRVPPVA